MKISSYVRKVCLLSLGLPPTTGRPETFGQPAWEQKGCEGSAWATLDSKSWRLRMAAELVDVAATHIKAYYSSQSRAGQMQEGGGAEKLMPAARSCHPERKCPELQGYKCPRSTGYKCPRSTGYKCPRSTGYKRRVSTAQNRDSSPSLRHAQNDEGPFSAPPGLLAGIVHAPFPVDRRAAKTIRVLRKQVYCQHRGDCHAGQLFLDLIPKRRARERQARMIVGRGREDR